MFTGSFKYTFLFVTTFVSYVCGVLPSRAQEMSDVAARGLVLIQEHCAKCHAVSRSDISPNPAAPPFRILGKRYPPESLQEAFAEGIVVGHAEMPEFKFRPSDIGDLIAYLKFVQRP